MIMNWINKKVLVVGAARQGLALARFLSNRGAIVTLNDGRPENDLKSAREQLNRCRYSLGFR